MSTRGPSSDGRTSSASPSQRSSCRARRNRDREPNALSGPRRRVHWTRRSPAWLWLVKWLLLIPHLIVLFFLWVAFCVVGVIAFFAILFTGALSAVAVRLQRRRAALVLAGALLRLRGHWAPTAIRRSPSPTCPTTRRTWTSTYPERLSRGLVLVKWWLLAIPHYLIVAVFVGGGLWLGTRGDHRQRLAQRLGRRRRPGRRCSCSSPRSCCCSPAATPSRSTTSSSAWTAGRSGWPPTRR